MINTVSTYMYNTHMCICIGVNAAAISSFLKVMQVIIDSGASSHMSPLRRCLREYIPREGKVSLGDSTVQIDILGVGNTTLVDDVLHVPQLSFGLISISKLDDDNYISVFRNAVVRVYNAIGDLILTGTKRNNLYYLDEPYRSAFISDLPDTDIDTGDNDGTISIAMTYSKDYVMAVRVNSPGFRPKSAILGWNKLELEHFRWCHAPASAIKLAYRQGLIEDNENCTYDDIKDLEIRFCVDCYRGKMRQKNKRPVSDKVWGVLGRVNNDWKKLLMKSKFGEVGFFLNSDTQSDYWLIYMTKGESSTSEALESLKVVKSLANKYGHTWSVLMTDDDSCYKTKSISIWLADNNVASQHSQPYKHSQNGKVERDMYTLMNMARTMMSMYNTPQLYWSFAINTAAYVWNRTHISSRTGKTPYHSVHGTIPDISHLVPFYAPGVFHLSKGERNLQRINTGAEWRAEPCRMLGYDEEMKDGYIVLNTRTNAISCRCDCIFDESFYEVLKEAQKNPGGTEIYKLLEMYGLDTSTDNADTPASNTRSSRSIAVLDAPDHLSCLVSSADIGYVHSLFFTYADECSRDDWWNNVINALLVGGNLDIQKLPPTPANVDEALSGPDKDKWMQAILNELDVMDKLGVLEIAEEQYGHGMKMKMLLKCAYNNDYSIKYKARLVACGYSQIHMRDFNETYAPTVAILVVLLVLHIAAALSLHTGTFDVTSAFLLAFNDFDNYAWLPSSIYGYKLRLRVLKALYGEKQSPKLWNELLHKILTTMGFTRCPFCACLYMRRSKDTLIILCIHVDDGLMCCSHEYLFDQFMSEFLTHLPSKATLLRPLRKYVGIHLDHDYANKTMKCMQHIYINDELVGGNDIESIPMCPSHHLRREPPNSDNVSLLPIVGQLRYLADRTRPDILVSVGEVSSGGADSPSDKHVRTASKIVGYLKSTAKRQLVLGGSPDLILFAFSDASYIAEGSSMSRLGGCLFLGLSSGAFSSFSKLAKLVAQSSMHAELFALDEVIRLVLHTRQILEFLGLPMSEPSKVFIDNRSAKDMCELLKMTHKTASINKTINWIRERINEGDITLHFVPTKLNVADVLTKPLPVDVYMGHTDKLMGGFRGLTIEHYIARSTLTIDMLYLVNADSSTH
jgi:hypothetical protein